MKKIFLYASIALALLYVVRELEYMGIRKNKKGEFAKLRIAFEEKNNFDMLFIGSSRAECQFYPPIIDSLLNVHSFNLGMTGATLPLIRSSLEAYLVNSNAPKYVVLNLDLHSFVDSPDTIYKFPRYFAYLNNEKLFDGLKERDSRFKLFKWIPFYSMPYFGSHYLDASLRGWMDKPGKFDEKYVHGFAPSLIDTEHGDLRLRKFENYYSIPKHFVFEELDSIKSICKKNNIILFFTISPLYYGLVEHVMNYEGIVYQFTDYATNQLHCPIIDMSHDPIQQNPENFSDPAHLNFKGALLFSAHFSALFAHYLHNM